MKQNIHDPFSPEIQQQIEDASATAAVKAFGTPKQKAARQRVEDALAASNERVGQDNNPNRNDDNRPTYTPAPSYTRPANDPYAEKERPRTRPTGLVDKPTVKKVVKGLEAVTKGGS